MTDQLTEEGATRSVTPTARGRLHQVFPPLLPARYCRTSSGADFVRATCLIVLLTAVALRDLPAQKKGDRVRVLAGTALRTAPGGQMVGVLSRTYEAPVEMVEGSAVRLRLSGFVSDDDVRIEAGGKRGLMGPGNTRSADGGTVRTGRGDKEPALATLQRGAVVFPGEKSASFFAVSRTVWVDKSRLAKFSGPVAAKSAIPTRPEPQATPPSAPVPVRQVPAPPNSAAGAARLAGAGDAMQTAGQAPLRSGPDGEPLFTIPTGTVVTPLSAENGWTRIRLEGWVPTSQLADLDAKSLSPVSAADIRADPEGMKGRIVRWTVENLSYQLADGLRRELNGEPYLLARGPGKERAILYLAVPDSLVEQARALAPLSTINITARVRSGRSQPGGVPILDLLELFRR